MQNKNLIKSPLNYTGGKFKLLPQLLPLFPANIDCFYDLFCGGANVAINVQAKKITASDINTKIIDLYLYFQSIQYNELLSEIERVIDHYGLSNTRNNSYEFYGCNSPNGLASFNRVAYEKIKVDYNYNQNLIFDRNLLFYVLVVFGFNNQIRFNKKGHFNIPIGKRDFNSVMEKNLKGFHDRVNSLNILFSSSDYHKDLEINSKNDFIYADPPYLITTASYNESNGWTENNELQLLSFLRSLDQNNTKFALSNVIEHKNKKNEILESWVKKNNYNIHDLNFSYKNSSYHGKNSSSVTREVLITNY